MSLPYGRKIRHKITTCKFSDEVTALLTRHIKKMPEYKDCEVICYPPMGLDHCCSIEVKNQTSKTIGYLTITDRKNGFVYVDYKAPKLNKYPKGSIGDMNGLNNVKRPLPTDIDKAIKLVFAK